MGGVGLGDAELDELATDDEELGSVEEELGTGDEELGTGDEELDSEVDADVAELAEVIVGVGVAMDDDEPG